MKTQFSRLLLPAFLSALLLACLWLPPRAQAQTTLTLSPAILTAEPGTNELIFSGTLTNSGSSAVTNGQDPAFNLLTGPSGEDLTTFPIYLDNFYAPNSLDPGQSAGQIFSVSIDPSTLEGEYTGNISFSYDGQLVGQDITVDVGPSAAPEPSTRVVLVLVAICLGTLLWRRRFCQRSQ